MSNIIPFASRQRRPDQGVVALSHMFASQRRVLGDVFWLKENAEWLGILVSLGTPVPSAALAPYQAFYDSAPETLAFFPQYYSFFIIPVP